jgi:hypothetical protein
MQFEAIIELFNKSQIDFILVGGVCAALHGAPINTIDIDFVYSQDPGNCQRLIDLLISINANFRGQGNRQLTIDLKHLTRGGQLLFKTDLGDIDLLSWIGNKDNILDYKYLIENHCIETIEINKETIKSLNLVTLIQSKELANRPKDQLHLLHLREIKTLQDPQE